MSSGSEGSVLIAQGIEIRGEIREDWKQILSLEALEFVAALHREFNQTRSSLLLERNTRQSNFDAGPATTHSKACCNHPKCRSMHNGSSKNAAL